VFQLAATGRYDTSPELPGHLNVGEDGGNTIIFQKFNRFVGRTRLLHGIASVFQDVPDRSSEKGRRQRRGSSWAWLRMKRRRWMRLLHRAKVISAPRLPSFEAHYESVTSGLISF
jgi:hypothetical protein